MILSRLSLVAVGLTAAALAGSCVAQEVYDEAVETADLYQRLYQDNTRLQEEVQADNARLAKELELYTAGEATPVEGSFRGEIDLRMAELEALLAEVGASSAGVSPIELEGGFGYSLRESVLFGSGSAEISAEGVTVLEGIARSFAEVDYRRIWVRGHTDSDRVSRPETLRRFPHGNIQLSAARAVAVASVLATAGVDDGRLAIAGLGPSEPLSSQDTADGKRMNRRVEIFVLEEEAEAVEAASTS